MEMAWVNVESGRGTGTTSKTVAINIGERLIKGGIDVNYGTGFRISAIVITIRCGETMTSIGCLATSDQVVNPLIGHNIIWSTWNVG